MKNHTNGNWTLVDDKVYMNPLSDDPCRNLPICTLHSCFGGVALQSNGKLIEQAPDMLEALEMLCNILQDNPKFTEGSFKNEYDFAMKIIKKANEL